MENNIIIRQGLKGFTTNDIELIQDVVKRFPRLSRNELAKTLCEHLNWVSPSGASKVKGCLTLLERLAEQDLVVLPDKLPHGRLTPDKPPSLTQRTLEKPLIKGALKDLSLIHI